MRAALYIYGASGHGKVVADAASEGDRYEVRGFLDDDPAKKNTLIQRFPVLGGLDALAEIGPDVAVGLGIGSNGIRQEILARLLERRASVASVVHPSAIVSRGAVLGVGTFVGPVAVVHTDARVGRACIVNTGAIVEHDDVLGDVVHIAPGAVLGGTVTVGEGALIGLGACVRPGLSIGSWAIVGAGAVVVESIPSAVTAYGVPARVMRKHDR